MAQDKQGDEKPRSELRPHRVIPTIRQSSEAEVFACKYQANDSALLAKGFEAAAEILHRQDEIEDRLTELVRRLKEE
jgi:hypothetical protein